ncbi:hypothetical protein, partial [Escherichia coli]|uniref:hypothetical protein n=1 Tax=Escherichia coli TaxID=562 RepID=UPI001BA60DB5
EKRVFLVILFTSFSGSLVSRISGAVQPDHQADSSQFVLRFNKTDKNHQRGSVRHYSALLYE